MGQLCDDNYTAVSNNNKLYATKEDEVLLQGNRNFAGGLWDIHIQKIRLQEENYDAPEKHGYIYTTQTAAVCTQQVKKSVNKKIHFPTFLKV